MQIGDDDFQIGDLVRVLNTAEQHTFIYRPHGFPFGKVGLIVDVSETHHYPPNIENQEAYVYPYGALDYDFRWYYDDLIMIFVEGKQYWVFKEEIEKLQSLNPVT